MKRPILAILFLLIIPIVIMIGSMYTPEEYTIYPGGAIYGFTPFDYILIPVILAYGFYPIVYSAEKLFRVKVTKQIIDEYRCIKYIIYFEIPIVLISILVIEGIINIPINLIMSVVTTAGLLITFAWSALAGIIWIVIVRKKGYQYYFAKAYIIESRENNDSLSREKDINRGLDYYNKYLQRYGNKIYNMKEIKSKFSNSSSEEQKTTLRSLSQAFETDDKGKPKEVLKDLFNVQPAGNISQKDRITAIFAERGIVVTVIIPIIGIIISILKE